MSKPNGHDPIAAAIDATEQPTVTMRQWGPVTISSTGRMAVVMLPQDATDAELAEIAGWLLTTVMGTYRAERERKPHLLVPALSRVAHG